MWSSNIKVSVTAYDEICEAVPPDQAEKDVVKDSLFSKMLYMFLER